MGNDTEINFKETPWMDWFHTRLGWTEFDHDQELSKGWKLTKHCGDFTTVIGATHAWCGMSLATALNSCGYSYPAECESADSYIGYGTPIIDWVKNGIPKGAVIVLRHQDGNHHVAVANSCDLLNGVGIIHTLGGNQHNGINIMMWPIGKSHEQISYVGWPVKRVV